MLSNLIRRTMATAASPTAALKPYPFSKSAIIHPEPYVSPPASLLQGKGLMPYLQKTLPPAPKQQLLYNLFHRQSRSPNRLYPGSVVQVTLEHAPFSFTGVVLGLRRRGVDSSFLLRNVISRTGVEMQVFAASPHVKEVRVLRKVARTGGRMKRAKLFYLRDAPEKMGMLAGTGKRGGM